VGIRKQTQNDDLKTGNCIVKPQNILGNLPAFHLRPNSYGVPLEKQFLRCQCSPNLP